jgi:CheY-like chemotaxis protein
MNSRSRPVNNKSLWQQLWSKKKKTDLRDENCSESILIVDDVKKDLQMLFSYVSDLEYPIKIATNFKDAVSVLENEPISMLITDIVMPMYSLTEEQYTEWIERSDVSHYYLRTGSRVEPVKRTSIRKQKTKDYSQLAGFELLDEARRIIPWLPVIIVSRYADLEMARHALGNNVNDILSKQEHCKDGTMLKTSVQKNMIPFSQRLVSMPSADVMKFLDRTSERTFTTTFLIPLFRDLGYQGIRYVHGSNERGIDLLFYDVDRLGQRRYIGVQVKAHGLHNRASDSPTPSVVTILNQVQEALLHTFDFDLAEGPIRLDRVLIVTSGHITSEARQYITSVLERKQFTQHVEFVDRTRLEELLQFAQKLKGKEH